EARGDAVGGRKQRGIVRFCRSERGAAVLLAVIGAAGRFFKPRHSLLQPRYRVVQFAHACCRLVSRESPPYACRKCAVNHPACLCAARQIMTLASGDGARTIARAARGPTVRGSG